MTVKLEKERIKLIYLFLKIKWARIHSRKHGKAIPVVAETSISDEVKVIVSIVRLSLTKGPFIIYTRGWYRREAKNTLNFLFTQP
jgi:hypothetical protein